MSIGIYKLKTIKKDSEKVTRSTLVKVCRNEEDAGQIMTELNMSRPDYVCWEMI